MEFKKELLKGTVVARGYSMQDVAEWLDINLTYENARKEN